jgi:hypothetical protein
MTFYVTFGQKSPFRNGWVEVEAENYRIARQLVVYALDSSYSMVYDEHEFKREYFPQGKLGETLK